MTFMYEKILVPLDGSPFSEEVLPLALGVAERCGAEIRLVHVRRTRERGIFLGRVVEEETAVEEGLEDLAAELSSESGISTSIGVLDAEEVVPELCAEIEREGIDLVVIATHGWGGLRRAWLGSVTDQLVRAASVPVLAVRPRGDEPRPDPPKDSVIVGSRQPIYPEEIEEALIALDGSDLSEEVIEPLLDLVGPEAHCTLIRVVLIPVPGDIMSASWDPSLWRDYLPSLRSEAERYLEGVEERIAGRVAGVEGVVLAELNAANAIIEYAREKGVGLIAMATHARRGVERLALGSVTDKVLRGADAPVLMVRPTRG